MGMSRSDHARGDFSAGARGTEEAHPDARARPLAVGLYDAQGYVALDRVALRFGLSKSQVAETAGLTRDGVYRPARLQGRKSQARITEMVEIINRVTAWAGGERQALAWYRSEPLRSFGDRTAESLVKDGKAGAVRDYLDRVATGGFA